LHSWTTLEFMKPSVFSKLEKLVEEREANRDFSRRLTLKLKSSETSDKIYKNNKTKSEQKIEFLERFGEPKIRKPKFKSNTEIQNLQTLNNSYLTPSFCRLHVNLPKPKKNLSKCVELSETKPRANRQEAIVRFAQLRKTDIPKC